MAFNLRPPWYRLNVSRMEAEEMLIKTNQPGSFIVRESESLQNTRVLSLLTINGVNHYRVEKSKDGTYFLATSDNVLPEYFESVEHLVSYYELPREQLPVALKIPSQEEIASIDSEKDDSDEDEIFDDQAAGSNISKFFLQQFEVLKGQSREEGFEDLVESYVRNKLAGDLYRVDNGAAKPPHLHKLILSAASDCQKSVDKFTKKLQFLQNLFDVGENDTMQRKKGGTIRDHAANSKSTMQSYSADIEGLCHQMESCKLKIMELEKKSRKVFEDYSGKARSQSMLLQQETYEVIPKAKEKSRSKHGFCQFFLAYKSNKKAKVYIAVNIKEGTVAFLKSAEDHQDASNSVGHKAISQLIKDKSCKTSLDVVTQKKVTTYHFEDFKSRELFCLMVERMKHVHSDHIKKGLLTHLTIFVGTWNMGSAEFPDDVSSWLKCTGMGKDKDFDPYNPYDIIAIGTQESGANEKELVTKIKDVLRTLFNIDYDVIAKGNLWDIRLVIFTKPMHLHQISNVKQSVVKLGLANALGNKGAVGISFIFGSTSFCFINSHLHARVERLAKRNRNFHDALRGLALGQQGFFDLTNNFHHLFWFGDLNYRVDGLEIEEVLKKVIGNDLDSLLEYDQLRKESRVGNAFFGFEEEKITFRPTYRYKVGSHNMYIWLKKKPGTNVTNVPSWPDRVLWKSFPEVFIANTSYGSTNNIVTSDHAPVFSTFDVGLIVQSQGLGCNTIKSAQEKVEVEFLHAEAKIRTSCKVKFILIFQSTCLEGQRESCPNSVNNWRAGKKDTSGAYSFPAWKMDDMPKLFPALSNQSYLEDQHIQIAVKADDGHESYGECVLALKRLAHGATEELVCCLTHFGDESGEIKLMVRVKTDMSRRNGSQVVKIVPGLQNVNDFEDDDDSGVTVDFDQALFGSRQRQSYDFSLVRNYELLGNIQSSDVPPIPPKKRLSKQLSYQGLSDGNPDTNSEIIWLGEQRSNASSGSEQCSLVIEKDPAPPPIPKRQSLANRSKRIDAAPTPKPRAKKLAKNNPKSVEEWLQAINMGHYVQEMIESGWDDVDYLDFTYSDLIEVGIHSEEDREFLMKSAELLKTKRRAETGNNT